VSRGIQRERAVRAFLESPAGGEWWTARAAGSLGDADIIAGKRGHRWQLIEVKSTVTPYSHFGPKDREELLLAAEKSGADAFLAYWPKHGKLEFISPASWPK